MWASNVTLSEWVGYGVAAAGFSYGVYQAVRKKLRGGNAEKKYGNPEVIRKTNAIDSKIHDHLTVLCDKAECARSVVFQFHNGDHFFSDSPLLRMSMTHESCVGGIANVKSEYSNIVVSLMAGVLDQMWDNTPLISSVDKLQDGYAKTMLKTLNVTLIACVPIKQNSHKIIGCLQLHWMGIRDVDVVTVKEPEIMRAVELIELQLAERLRVTGTW